MLKNAFIIFIPNLTSSYSVIIKLIPLRLPSALKTEKKKTQRKFLPLYWRASPTSYEVAQQNLCSYVASFRNDFKKSNVVSISLLSDHHIYMGIQCNIMWSHICFENELPKKNDDVTL